MYPLASPAVIKELKAKITPLTQDLIIVKASGSELKILGTAVIYMKAEVLGEDRKKLEVAMIEGQEGSKEILGSLKLMKAWNVKSYTSYHSIQTSNSKPLDPPSQSCTLMRDKIIWDWKGIFKEKLEKTDRLNIALVSINLKGVPYHHIRAGHTTHLIIFTSLMTEN